jgi:aminoglycoside phosphotransferase (APT) family kinase protein
LSNAVDIVERIQHDHGLRFGSVESFEVGESRAALRVTEVDGGLAVLKWFADPRFARRIERAAEVTAQLRALGYPAPEYRLVAGGDNYCFCLREYLPGSNPKKADDVSLQELMSLNAMLAGRGPERQQEPRRLMQLTFNGGEGYCLLEPMREYSPEAAGILKAVQDTVRAASDVTFRYGDIVHFDFNPANILVDSGRVTGIVDWEGVSSGDRGYDVATLLFYCWTDAHMRDVLWREGTAISGTSQFKAYLANQVHRQIDWSIRHHSREVIHSWIALGADIMETLQRD